MIFHKKLNFNQLVKNFTWHFFAQYPVFARKITNITEALIKNAVNGQQHMNNQELFGSLPRVSETIRARRLRFAGQCARHNEETASKVLLSEPQHDQELHFKADTGLDNTKELRNPMLDQVVWKDYIRSTRDDSRPN